ncbi:CidA/LrgA family protein [Aneurinibacillus migulanus]|uniref:CidA/LrgA family protein n=1 Tax=Aneurinibacillus migulanus TaxID=47500 RepID=UPI0006A14713|nr:CidA/LrgA family protein [Aneurinibacillus migulanus]MCP1356576.1 CidA/LrgA family protein [Aneurinibacillus migulanus]MED4727352.1 CidA/LrgA family protein [Aneurinibacillus migulanus]CEH29297.1 LrgA family protein [Aneurinibacillus migulanus]
MKRKITIAIRIVVQIIFLYSLNELGNLVVGIFHLPIPGTLIGLLLLFSLLLTKIVPLQWIEEASSLLLKHLSFFFIPIAVGLMSYGDLLLHQGWLLFLLILVSLWIGIYTTGRVSQFLVREQESNQE